MKNSKLSCFIIGEGPLLIRCVEFLLQEEHEVYGIISPEKATREWAAAHGISAFAPEADLIPILGRRPFDYLFSIVNFRLLPDAVLQLPRKGAINFHNALLPKYGGFYSTSWALMNQEAAHGIT